MKLIDISQRYFRYKDDTYFCVDAETDSNLNVRVVRARCPVDGEMIEIRGSAINSIIPEDGDTLGMPYRPASTLPKLDTSIPDSMADDIHKALQNLRRAVGGNVEDFVCERLQWTHEQLADRLFAEQVDAVALSIYNIEARNQSLVIGDQTGIGKGRMAACMVRYAKIRGLFPVFVTQKAKLFSDFYRDLTDIGCADLVPLIMNSDSEAAVRIQDPNDDEKMITVYRPQSDKAYLKAPATAIKKFDYMMTTYSQFSNLDKEATASKAATIGKSHDKIVFLQAIAPKSIIILDEAHTASGSTKGEGRRIKKGDHKEESAERAKKEVEGSAIFKVFYEVIQSAKGVCYLSATFAKRPENMPLFAARTCIRESGLKNTDLISAITSGGEALQEVLSSSLVREGQMMRRERTYDGIKVNYIYLNKQGSEEFGVPDLEAQHRAASDVITGLMRKITKFEEEYVNKLVATLNLEQIMMNGGDINKTSKNMGVTNAPYFSKVFNVIKQTLFAIKANAVADHAVRRLKEGKKVVIAFSSTMEAMLQDLVSIGYDTALEGGSPQSREINTDYSVSLIRGLKASMKIISHDINGKATGTRYLLPEELGKEGLLAYHELIDEIKNSSSGISISPIDIIRQRIEQEGYRVSEVTNRHTKCVFTNKEGTRGYITTFTPENRTEAFAKFQNNRTDVLLLNTTGSTGASAHATTKNTNLRPDQVKPRCMIIAECELDVSAEVQKRGRINRTGQIPQLPPSYDYLMSAIPAEQRMMMMMQKKLKSLDANSTSNQKQSTSIIDTDDFLNKYGDRVVTEILKGDLDLNKLLGDPLKMLDDNGDPKNDEKKSNDDTTNADATKKVTGRVAILSVAEQEKFYNALKSNYERLVTNLKNRGEYDLEVEAMDLQAKEISRNIVVARTNGKSVFSDAVYDTLYEVNVLQKPYTASDIRNMIQVNTEGKHPDIITGELFNNFIHAIEATRDKDIAEKKAAFAQKRDEIRNVSPDKLQKAIAKSGGNKDAIDLYEEFDRINRETEEKSVEKITNRCAALTHKASIIRFFYPGRACLYGPDMISAVCLGWQIVNDKAKNIYTPGNVSVSFALASSEKCVDYNLADNDYPHLLEVKEKTMTLDRSTDVDSSTLDRWDSRIKSFQKSRELRHIYTGNPLRAYAKASEVLKDSGKPKKLISFTLENGDIERGVLMPRTDDADLAPGTATATFTQATMPIDDAWKYIKDKFDNFAENDTINFTRGFKIRFDIGYYHLVELKTASDTAADRQIANSDLWLKDDKMFEVGSRNYGDYGNYRGFKKNGGRYTLRLYDLDWDKFRTVINVLNKLGLSVELSQQEADRYLTTDDSAQSNNWPPLAVNKAEIPKGKRTKRTAISPLLASELRLAAANGGKHHKTKPHTKMDKATLQTIKSGTFPATPEGDIYREMQKQVGIITNDFTAPQNISTQKVDMTEICKQNGITPKQFEDYFGSIQRSEADAVQHLAAQCASTAVAPAAPGTDKAKRLRLAKAKMKMAAARLQLMNI